MLGLCWDWLSTLLLLGFVLLLFYIYGTWTFSTWAQAGVPGPKPQPFVGNALEFRKKGTYYLGQQWCKQYGKTFGIYFARRPVLMTSDLDVLKEVLIRDFNNFQDMAVGSLVPYPLNLSLAYVHGDQWKRLRQTVTASFTASKFKMMGRFVTRCCDNLAAAIDQCAETGEPIDAKRMFGSFTLDVIAGTGFGFETNSLANDGSVFLHHVKIIFGGNVPFKLASIIALLIPSLVPALKFLGFSVNPKKNVNFLTEAVRNMIEERKRGEKGGPDFIQQMLDSEASDEEVAKEPHKRHLTRDELIAQSLLLFVAGYETTSATLQMLAYLLALHPDKQEKLYQEIVETLGEDVPPTYDNITSLPYMESCIYETLRNYPPVPVMGRKCEKETTVQGIKMPAGTKVMVNIIGLMRDEDIFPQPHLFLPERYLDEEHPIPQMAKDMVFGAGPRQCLGMRLSLYEIKMALVTILRKFRFVKVKDTPGELIMTPGELITISKPIYIGAERR